MLLVLFINFYLTHLFLLLLITWKEAEVNLVRREGGNNKIYKNHHFQSPAFLYFHLCSCAKLSLDILLLSPALISNTTLFPHPAAGSGNEDGTNIYAFNMTNNCTSLKLLPWGQYHSPGLYQWSSRTETELQYQSLCFVFMSKESLLLFSCISISN